MRASIRSSANSAKRLRADTTPFDNNEGISSLDTNTSPTQITRDKGRHSVNELLSAARSASPSDTIEVAPWVHMHRRATEVDRPSHQTYTAPTAFMHQAQPLHGPSDRPSSRQATETDQQRFSRETRSRSSSASAHREERAGDKQGTSPRQERPLEGSEHIEQHPLGPARVEPQQVPTPPTSATALDPASGTDDDDDIENLIPELRGLRDEIKEVKRKNEDEKRRIQELDEVG